MLNPSEVKTVLETALLATQTPLSIGELRRMFEEEIGADTVRRLLDEEGLCLGLSSGINVAGAVRLAEQLGPGKRIATILCDTGFRYLSTLHDPAWRAEKGLA